jgi:alginate O-acetyltransferase complex protein AlgI
LVFSSAVFLFAFLPITLALYYLLNNSYRNILLLFASLLFYAWGEPVYLILMIGSVLFNWAIGLAMSATRHRNLERGILTLGVAANLLVLAHYKYTYFLISNLNYLIEPITHTSLYAEQIPLPVGISFFTFHAISYIVDVYRRQADALKSPLEMGLYISLFPQLVAGPIIRYHDVASQLLSRTNNIERFTSGIERFVYGLGKKIIIANTLGEIADQAFSATPGNLSAATAWIGIICYTLQIYFDFSGYSDMAIGLARMFGFELTENFNYPYISKSVREFWRRWHLSLSTWFRDYLYIPLGGNRGSAIRVRLNLLTVFFLCGLWHGASWNFAIWGLFHGALLVLERGKFGKLVDNAPAVVRHAYTIAMIMLGWVFFRADTLTQAVAYLQALAGLTSVNGVSPQILALLTNEAKVIVVLGVVLSTPYFAFLSRDWKSRRFPPHAQEPLPSSFIMEKAGIASYPLLSARTIISCLILILSISQVTTTTYNPFIYFRF